jgi:hypothetical protein
VGAALLWLALAQGGINFLSAASVSPVEPLGPSSRHSGLVISEIMYNPLPRADFRNLEFVELFNSNPFPEDLSGYRLSSDVNFYFPPGTVLPGRGFLVIAKSPGDIQTVYGINNVVGPFTGNLANGNGQVRLRNREGVILLEVQFDNDSPWPAAADGAGHSLILARPSFGEGTAQAWAASDAVGGSPGTFDPVTSDPLRAVVINELLANVEAPNLDYVEFFNRSAQLVDISGCILTDDPTLAKFTFPPGTAILPGGFLAIDEFLLGFSFGANGEAIYFSNPTRTRVLDGVRFPAQALGVSLGRFPDGANTFRLMSANTPFAPNSAPFRSDVIISEIMYAPISGDSDDEYVELHNRGTNAVALGGWMFTDGIEFTIPSGVVLPPDGFLVIANNATALKAKYPNLTSQNILGNFSGGLARAGEQLALVKPEVSFSTNNLGVVSSNVLHVVADQITYAAGEAGALWANGGGSSRELIDARADSALADNWRDSDESAKAPWTTLTATSVLENGPASGEGSVIRNLQVVLLGAGECLLDDVEVFAEPGGPNLVTNSTFEIGANGWTFQGNHVRTSIETTEGFNSTRSLHLRATSRGDTGPNRVLVPLNGSLTPTQTVTLRAKVRWLRGSPEIVMRLHGNWLEAATRLSLPENLGTPGAPNSRAVTNAAPVIYEVQHRPVLPTNQQPVLVTARAYDPDGLSSLTLRYRVDPAVTSSVVPMIDDGTNGDAVAGDGIYSALIPGKAAGVLVAFYVEAADNFNPPATMTFPSDAPARECFVRFGETMATNHFGSYRLWLSQRSISNWINRPVLSREPVDGTFVYGNERVIYNVGARYAATPFVRNFSSPTGAPPCNYFIDMASDPFLGANAIPKLRAPGHLPADDATLQCEQTAYWMAGQIGLPRNHSRYVNVFVNGFRRGTLMEDVESPTPEAMGRWFPNEPEGNLFKSEPWLEFDDAGNSFSNRLWATLNNYASANGAQKPLRYRWNFQPISPAGAAQNYDDVFNLVTFANVPPDSGYTMSLESLVDVEQWVRTLALEHALGNWDSFGHRNSENTYLYKPDSEKWKLAISDFNVVLGNAGANGPGGDNLFEHVTSDKGMTNFYGAPAFQRAYWRALKMIAEGPLESANVDPILDARYAAFSANGINALSPDAPRGPVPSLKVWIVTRQYDLLSRLANIAAPFSIAGPGAFTAPNNLITLTGTAPIEAASLLINGYPYPVTWVTLTNWSISLILNAGTSVLNVQAYDSAGFPLGGMSGSVFVAYNGSTPSAQNHLVINEIMFKPLVADGEYVEIFNTSTTHAFDLSNWQLKGLGYTFPPGTFITNRQFLVLAKNRLAFANAYGAAIPVRHIFTGNLRDDSETLALLAPSTPPAFATDKVRYEAALPWPAAASAGSSLQLIDPNQDNSRVGNWFSSLGAGASTPDTRRDGWRFFSASGSIGSGEIGGRMRLLIYLDTGGSALIDDLSIVAGTNAAAGFNYVANGDFESPLTQGLTNSWQIGENCYGDSLIVSDLVHAGTGAFKIIGTNGAGAANAPSYSRSIFQWLSPAPAVNSANTLSFWYWATNSASNLLMRVRFSNDLTTGANGTNIHIFGMPSNYVPSIVVSPGRANQMTTNLPPFPSLWLNEVHGNQSAGLADNAGDRDPWIELYNAGTTNVSLDGFSLANNYTNLAQWNFPPGQTIGPGQYLLIWADGEPNETSGTDLHTSFRLGAPRGSVALSRTMSGQTMLMDYLNYDGLESKFAYGAYGDGQPFYRAVLRAATPRASNAPPPLFINEWMASNTNTIVDPADAQFEDWFEIFNAGPTAVDLSSHYVTDRLTTPTQSEIPEGTLIPAGGFLLIWADSELAQNNPGQNEIHADFSLSRGGESLGLATPDGRSIDELTFPRQTDDVTEGRYPDGSLLITPLRMPTPRAANSLPRNNSPPAIGNISNQFVVAGQTVSFTVTATDPEAPPQFLSYTFAVAPPPGASIHSSSGAFTWTTAPTQIASTNVITIRVRDNGLPQLDATRSFTIFVRSLLPPVSVAQGSNGTISISWPTTVGRTYRVEFKDDFNSPGWTPLGANITGNGSPFVFNETIGTRAQRFYRVVEVD